MRTVLVIGIGAGHPEHVTVQAVNALQRVDVFFVLDKGAAKQDLKRLREEILTRYAGEHRYRVVQREDPERDLTSGGYAEAVSDWHRRRAELYEQLVRDELADGETGAFLVWGDPTLYDSTLAILDGVRERGGVTFEYEVIPGISSVSALAAGHRTALNQVGRPVQVTTGRRLAQSWPAGVDDVVVMLDGQTTFARYAGDDGADIDIFWGAYVGTPDEILVSGRLSEVAAHIQSVRAEARERKGWLMDTYLLRRRPEDGPPER